MPGCTGHLPPQPPAGACTERSGSFPRLSVVTHREQHGRREGVWERERGLPTPTRNHKRDEQCVGKHNYDPALRQVLAYSPETVTFSRSGLP